MQRAKRLTQACRAPEEHKAAKEEHVKPKERDAPKAKKQKKLRQKYWTERERRAVYHAMWWLHFGTKHEGQKLDEVKVRKEKKKRKKNKKQKDQIKESKKAKDENDKSVVMSRKKKKDKKKKKDTDKETPKEDTKDKVEENYRAAFTSLNALKALTSVVKPRSVLPTEP